MTARELPAVKESKADTSKPSGPGFFSAVADTVRDAVARPMADYYLMMAVTVAFLVLGLFMVLSASSVIAMATTRNHDAFYYGRAQLLYALAGVPIAAVCSRLSERAYRIVGGLAMVAVLVALIVVIIPHGPGVVIGGQRAWLRITATQTVQPAEFAKAALIVWSASLFATPWRQRRLDRTRTVLSPYLPVCGLVLLLVVLQKDFGTAAILGVILLMQLWFAGAPGKILGALLALAGVGAAIVAYIKWHTILAFLATRLPFLHLPVPPGASDQPDNALYGLATGGWWGVGIGASRQKWGGLYSGAYTDYILAVIGEELGLVGVLLVLGLLFALVFTGLRIARRSDSFFWRLAAAGMTGWLMVQATVNTLVAFGLLPVLGVPFPFLSYGGSSLWASLVAVGVLLAAARHEPEAVAEMAHSKGGRRQRGKVPGVVVRRG